MIVSKSDAEIKIAGLNASTKVKFSNLTPILTPASPPPTISINSSSLFESLLASKHSRTTLPITSSSTNVSRNGVGYNGCGVLMQPPQCSSQSPQNEKWHFPGPNQTFCKKWRGYYMMDLHFYSPKTLIISFRLNDLSHSDNVSMSFQGSIEEQYSSVTYSSIFYPSASPIFNLLTNHQLRFITLTTSLHQSNSLPPEHQRFSAWWNITATFWNFATLLLRQFLIFSHCF